MTIYEEVYIGRRMGRKPIKKPAVAVVTAKMSVADIAAMKRETLKREWSVSHYVRRAIILQLERDRNGMSQEAT